MEASDFTISNGTLTKYSGEGGIVTVPDGVTSIGYVAVTWNSTITEVILPETLTSLQTEAFEGCDRLEKINLPHGLTKLGGNCLRYTAIEKLDIPDTVTEICYGALNGCLNLKRLRLPSGITKISDRLLAECSSLCEVEIPAGITYIGRDSFSGTALESVVIPDSVTHICADAFNHCKNLQRIVIPASVTKMGEPVFHGSPSVTVYTPAGSYAEEYAKNHGIPVVNI